MRQYTLERPNKVQDIDLQEIKGLKVGDLEPGTIITLRLISRTGVPDADFPSESADYSEDLFFRILRFEKERYEVELFDYLGNGKAIRSSMGRKKLMKGVKIPEDRKQNVICDIIYEEEKRLRPNQRNDPELLDIKNRKEAGEITEDEARKLKKDVERKWWKMAKNNVKHQIENLPEIGDVNVLIGHRFPGLVSKSLFLNIGDKITCKPSEVFSVPLFLNPNLTTRYTSPISTTWLKSNYIQDWNGIVLEDYSRDQVRAGNVVRVLTRYSDGSGQSNYYEIVKELEERRLLGLLHSVYAGSGVPWNEDSGGLFIFERENISELPLEWGGNEELKKVVKESKKGSAFMTGFFPKE